MLMLTRALTFLPRRAVQGRAAGQGRRRNPANGDYGDYKSGAGKVGDKDGAGG